MHQDKPRKKEGAKNTPPPLVNDKRSDGTRAYQRLQTKKRLNQALEKR